MLLYPPTRGQTATTEVIPAPTGGLNSMQPLSAMDPKFASVMTNLYPYASYVGTRYGISTHATHASISVAAGTEGLATMMNYIGPGAETLFIAFNWTDSAGVRCRISSVADNGTITTAREITVPASATNVSSLGEWDLFTSGSGTSYLIYCASVDTVFTPQIYDGSTWAAASITGCPQNTAGVSSHRSRLWFYDGSTKPLSAFYLPVGAISGAVTEFNLGPVARKGGRIVALRTWTQDGGEGGTDDLAAFYTSQGQVIFYSGTDPASRATWQLVGVFDIGRPACMLDRPSLTLPVWGLQRGSYAIKYGADVLFIAEDGLTSAARVMNQQVGQTDYSISTNIRSLIVADVRAKNNANSLVKAAYFPPLRQIFLQAAGSASFLGTGPFYYQTTGSPYVMNAETGAWTKFEWAGSVGFKDCVVYKGDLYFNDGAYKVYRYGQSSTTSDNGSAFTFECRQAYSYLNSPDNKLATLMLPTWSSTGNISLTLNADADFNARSISAYTSYTSTSMPRTISPAIGGIAFAAHLKGQTSAGVLSWYTTKWAAVPGGVL